MNNEPVAWMCQDNVTEEWEFSSMKHCHKCEPLYTRLIKRKRTASKQPQSHESSMLNRSDNYISDEVIEQLAKQFGVVGLHEDAGLYEFARAILRKAQDK
jgi:hypothetical protein